MVGVLLRRPRPDRHQSWPEGWWDSELCLWLLLLPECGQSQGVWWLPLLPLSHVLDWVLLLSCGGPWTY